MAIDRADWHWDAAEQVYRRKNGLAGELTEQQILDIWMLAAAHIGVFLEWIIDRGWEGEEADPASCALVRERKKTGAAYLMDDCDGKLWDEDIREDILPFVEAYYTGEGYLRDYDECCGSYSGSPRPEDLARLRARMERAYETYQRTHPGV